MQGMVKNSSIKDVLHIVCFTVCIVCCRWHVIYIYTYHIGVCVWGVFGLAGYRGGEYWGLEGYSQSQNPRIIKPR